MTPNHKLNQLVAFSLDLNQYQFWHYNSVKRFQRSSATGVACWQGTLTPPDTWSRLIWDLNMFFLLRPILVPSLSLFYGLCSSNITRYFLYLLYLQYDLTIKKTNGMCDLIHTVKSTVRSMTTRLFTWYFHFQNTCNTNKFVWVSRWISGFYITKSCKECN